MVETEGQACAALAHSSFSGTGTVPMVPHISAPNTITSYAHPHREPHPAGRKFTRNNSNNSSNSSNSSNSNNSNNSSTSSSRGGGQAALSYQNDTKARQHPPELLLDLGVLCSASLALLARLLPARERVSE